jgi:hypothetical protein
MVVDVKKEFIYGKMKIRNCYERKNGEEVVEKIKRMIEKVEFEKVL